MSGVYCFVDKLYETDVVQIEAWCCCITADPFVYLRATVTHIGTQRRSVYQGFVWERILTLAVGGKSSDGSTSLLLSKEGKHTLWIQSCCCAVFRGRDPHNLMHEAAAS